ncbi:hypothetical protein EGT74_25685 [Chitinophaga lutea]|uniref:Type VI secretion system baseplate subunit TssG n=1 Tax=Chitinophaga lutea TaxID=2488634 RepID=A0A3N4PE90_9BACT|nr:type VI secretion system baseplate subunit TssG [Chitinophaga lutea]RPE05758.1 hypothetical protein EGT74_25685 [Chitinophaga lutea]
MEEMGAFNLNNFDTDYKAAVLAAELVESGFDINNLFIWPAGNSRRNFSRDVQSVEWHHLEHAHKSLLCIKTSREGLYDMLPEGLFHQPVPYSSTRSTEEIIDQIKRYKEEEKQARRFFLPLEAELNLFRVLIELRENKIDKKNIYDDLIRIFHPGWEIFSLLDQQQANIFLHMLPFLHEAKSDLTKLEHLLSLLLQMPARIAFEPAGPLKAETAARMGEAALGVDTICGEYFDEGDEAMIIHIGPVSPHMALQLFPGERLEKIVRWLVAYFVPAETTVHLQTDILPEQRALVLDEAAVLGYTAFI